MRSAGFGVQLAEPAETSILRGPKRRAKTDRADARLLRELLEQSRLPVSWIPPAWILDLRTTVRLRKTLVDERTAWQQRIHALLYHHGVPRPEQQLLARATRDWLGRVALPQRAGRRWRSRCASSTPSTPSWTRSTAGCVGWLAASRAAGR
jgi:transposase